MNPYQIIFILVIHFIGDIICQDGAMASQKSKHFSWLVLHVLIYSAVIFFMMLLGMVIFNNWSFYMVLVFTLIIFVCHFIVDYITSKINAYHKEEGKNHLLWIGIGAEQLIHTSILIYSLHLLLLN